MKRTPIILAAAGYALAAISTASLAAVPKPTAKAAAAQAKHTQTLIVEKDVPQSPDKVWQAITQSALIEKWLMKNDFQPVVGRKYKFTADWGSVDGKVLAVEANKKLSYTWVSYGLKSMVTWTLTPTSKGTHVRMAQSGFPPDQPQYYQGAQGGWQKNFAALEQVLAR